MLILKDTHLIINNIKGIMRRTFLHYQYILIIFACQLLISCTNNMDNWEYKKALLNFPDSSVNHFPKKIQSDFITWKHGFDAEERRIYFMFFEHRTSDTLATQKEYLNKECIGIYSASDTNLFIVKSYRMVDQSNIKRKFRKVADIDNMYYYPIPYFNVRDEDLLDLSCRKNTSGLSSDFTIYVLEVKSGNYIKGLKPLVYMPEGWENGYSKGYAISEEKKMIIYWVVVW